jgi:LuxR family transcriptional regulator, quorum-sensing system regulator CciR
MELGRLQDFVDVSRQLTAQAQLHDLLAGICGDMGFDYFALIHRVDLPQGSSCLEDVNQAELVALSNYPEKWVETYITQNLIAHDPVVLAAAVAHRGFHWSEVESLIELEPIHYDVWQMGRDAGITDGYTVPARMVGRGSGSCNFAVGPDRELPRDKFIIAEMIGIHAFHAARSLVEKDGPGDDRVRLTPRQRECIELVGRGKTDWEISRILGISPATVKEHIDDARRKYGVSKRVQVVLRAAFEGQIELASVLA